MIDDEGFRQQVRNSCTISGIRRAWRARRREAGGAGAMPRALVMDWTAILRRPFRDGQRRALPCIEAPLEAGPLSRPIANARWSSVRSSISVALSHQCLPFGPRGSMESGRQWNVYVATDPCMSMLPSARSLEVAG